MIRYASLQSPHGVLPIASIRQAETRLPPCGSPAMNRCNPNWARSLDCACDRGQGCTQFSAITRPFGNFRSRRAMLSRNKPEGGSAWQAPAWIGVWDLISAFSHPQGRPPRFLDLGLMDIESASNQNRDCRLISWRPPPGAARRQGHAHQMGSTRTAAVAGRRGHAQQMGSTR
jgi:hypothetical protein